MINKAIHFATTVHSNQTRKGTNIPYILHCLEVGTIAASLSTQKGNIDEDVVSAAILHDTIEDAYVSYETLKEVFNEKIADLVQAQSEDKSKPWIDRKKDTINFLYANKSIDVEIVTLADKLSNMRSIYKDYQIMGEQLWNKFNAGKEMQYWYYNSIAKAITQIQDTKEHKEYRDLINKVFNIEEGGN